MLGGGLSVCAWSKGHLQRRERRVKIPGLVAPAVYSNRVAVLKVEIGVAVHDYDLPSR